MGQSTDAELARAEARIAAGGDFVVKIEEVAALALDYATVLEHLGEREAAIEQRALVEAVCAVIDRRRRAAGLPTSVDELA